MNASYEWDKLGQDTLRTLELGETIPDELTSEAKKFIESMADY
jgi:hypothetical protein